MCRDRGSRKFNCSTLYSAVKITIKHELQSTNHISLKRSSPRCHPTVQDVFRNKQNLRKIILIPQIFTHLNFSILQATEYFVEAQDKVLK